MTYNKQIEYPQGWIQMALDLQPTLFVTLNLNQKTPTRLPWAAAKLRHFDAMLDHITSSARLGVPA